MCPSYELGYFGIKKSSEKTLLELKERLEKFHEIQQKGKLKGLVKSLSILPKYDLLKGILWYESNKPIEAYTFDEQKKMKLVKWFPVEEIPFYIFKTPHIIAIDARRSRSVEEAGNLISEILYNYPRYFPICFTPRTFEYVINELSDRMKLRSVEMTSDSATATFWRVKRTGDYNLEDSELFKDLKNEGKISASTILLNINTDSISVRISTRKIRVYGHSKKPEEALFHVIKFLETPIKEIVEQLTNEISRQLTPRPVGD